MKLFLSFLLLSQISLAANFASDIDKTFASAKKENKPLLIYFYGIWCPPCNELKETVYESTGFLNKSKSFKLLQVDVDAKNSWKVKSRYKVGGYPTVVFADPKGAEIYRIVGYRTPNEFIRVMDLVLNSKNKSIEKACQSKSNDDIWRCAVICSERKDKVCAETAFKKLEATLKPGSARYELARTYSIENAPNHDLKKDGYERLMNEFPESPQALVWASNYHSSFDEKVKTKPKNEVIEKVLNNYSKMVNDPKREELGISHTDMAQIRADLLEKIGKKTEAVAAWKEAAGLLEKEANSLPKGTVARGFTLERIYCLESAGELDAALKLSQEYREKFPEEFTFYYTAASILNRAKKYSEAIPLAQKAYGLSYGDNKIRVATLLIKLYATIPDKEGAKKVFHEVNSEIKPDSELEIRTHRYLINLQKAYLDAQIS